MRAPRRRATWGRWGVLMAAVVSPGCTDVAVESPLQDSGGGGAAPVGEGNPKSPAGDAASIPDGSPDASSELGTGFLEDIPLSSASLAASSIPGDPRYTNIFSLFGFTKTDAWGVGSNGLAIHYDGVVWIQTPTPLGTDQALFSVWGTSPTRLWAVSNSKTVLRGSGGPGGVGFAWEALPNVEGDSLNPFYAVWAPTDGALWVGGSGVEDRSYRTSILHGDATLGNNPSWSYVSTERPDRLDRFITHSVEPVYALWGSRENDFWIAGGYGTIGHATEDGVRWQIDYTETLTENALLSLHGTSATNVWAVGAGGTVRAWNAAENRWSYVASPTTRTLNAVRAFDNGEIWVAGDASTLLTYDGRAWRRVDVPGPKRRLLCVWGLDSNDVWVGGQSALLHVTREGGSQ